MNEELKLCRESRNKSRYVEKYNCYEREAALLFVSKMFPTTEKATEFYNAIILHCKMNTEQNF